jgi:hypothetical protein
VDIASNKVQIYFDGAWVEKTQGDGHDQVSYTFAALDSSGHKTQGGDNLGEYNDRGNDPGQEVRKIDPLVQFNQASGQSAVGVFSIYGTSNGIDWGGIVHGLQIAVSVGTTIAGWFGDIVASSNSDAYNHFVNDTVKLCKPTTGYVGSVRINIFTGSDGHTTWSVSPIDNSFENTGLNPDGSWTVKLKSPTEDGKYWPKLGVKAS